MFLWLQSNTSEPLTRKFDWVYTKVTYRTWIYND